MMNKKNVMHWEMFKYFLKMNYKKIHSKIHLHIKVFFGKKDM